MRHRLSGLFATAATLLLILTGCVSGPRIDLTHRTGGNAFLYHQFQAYDGRTGQPISFTKLAQRARSADVVLFGEMHGDLVCNQVEAQLLHALLRHGRKQTLAMEFFEADEQSAVDAYLAGRIDEPDFVETADRPKSYLTTHRPLIELCRSTHTPILAANAPRRLVSGFRKFDGDYAAYRANLKPEERQWLPPELEILSGPYCDRFEELMSGHGDMPAPPPATQPSSQPAASQPADSSLPPSSQPASLQPTAQPIEPEATEAAQEAAPHATTTAAPAEPAVAVESQEPLETPAAEQAAPHAMPAEADTPPAAAAPAPHAMPASQPTDAQQPPDTSPPAAPPHEMPPAEPTSIPAGMPTSMPATMPMRTATAPPAKPPASMPAMSPKIDWHDFYRAQMLWDEAMAESIAAYRTLHDDRHVLLIVGAFHVPNDGGTTIKLFKRCPDAEVLTVQYATNPDGQFAFDENDRGRADVIIYGISPQDD